MMRKSTRKWRKNADTITILAAGLIKQSYSTIATCLDRNDTYLQKSSGQYCGIIVVVGD